jgi:hypothetical protein
MQGFWPGLLMALHTARTIVNTAKPITEETQTRHRQLLLPASRTLNPRICLASALSAA